MNSGVLRGLASILAAEGRKVSGMKVMIKKTTAKNRVVINNCLEKKFGYSGMPLVCNS